MDEDNDAYRKKLKSSPIFKQESKRLRKQIFVQKGFETQEQMKKEMKYGAYCNHCKHKVGEKLIDIVRHMAESNCVGYYRRTYEHSGLFCQAYNISANVDFGEAGPLLRLINDKHLEQTLTETPSHKKFNEYRIAQLTKILAGDQAAHQEYIRSVKDLIKGFIILHNIYTGSTLDNQVRSQRMVQGLQLMNPKLTDKCLKSILPTKRDVSLAGLKALEKYLFGVYVEKQMGRKNAFAFNLSLDGWQSISKEETLGVVFPILSSFGLKDLDCVQKMENQL